MGEILSAREVAEKRFSVWDEVVRSQKEELFIDYVKERIRKRHPKATVEKQEKSITFITASCHTRLDLFPIWKENIQNIKVALDEDVSKAITQIYNRELKNVYLIYPKSKNFSDTSTLSVRFWTG